MYARSGSACVVIASCRRWHEPADRAWNRWSGAVSPRVGLKILRSSSSVSTGGDLCAGGSAAGAVDAGGMGGRLQPVSQAASGSVATARHERDEAAWG